MAKKKVAKKAVKKAAPAAKKAVKKVAKAAAPKKAAAKTATKKTAKAGSGGGFMKVLELSEELGHVIGNISIPRTEVIKKLWAYIKKHNLQDPKNKRNILADEKLQKVFGKNVVNMFEMTKLVGKHLK